MSHSSKQESSIAVMLARLNHEEHWHLSEAEQQNYLTALSRYISDPCDDAKQEHIIINYYKDHALVEALQNRGHLEHEDGWNKVLHQTIGILRQNGLAWSSDGSVQDEDLIQVAQLELTIALESFSYASRFKTWAYRVIIWSVQRKLRDLRARKRGDRPDYIDQFTGMNIPVDESMHPESIASARLLAEQVSAILLAQPDERLERIFRLWAHEGRSVKEIGEIIHLHPSRVRVLLGQARHILQNHPSIQSWHDSDDSGLNEEAKDKNI